VRPNEFTMSSLIEAYLKAGYATEALKLQERMPEMRLRMDDVLETQRIRALAQLGLFDNATLALQEFVSRVKLQGGKECSGGWKRASIGAIPYNELIKQAHGLQRRDTAKDVLAMMLKDGVSPNRMTYELFGEGIGPDKTFQGMPRVQYMLDVITLVRQYGHRPLGPLYVEALSAAVDANEPELAGLLLDDASDGKFSISKAERPRIEQLETRVWNLMQMSADGMWYQRGPSKALGTRRLGSGGRSKSLGTRRLGSSGTPFITGSARNEWDFDGAEASSDPKDRDWQSAEWW
jgi:pentatricopeptide repeat protein